MNEDELREARWEQEERALAEVVTRHAIELGMGLEQSECPIGWIPIVDELFRDLAARGCRHVVQIKEKLGRLRVYLPEGESSEATMLVERAEERSAHTCERCGSPGTERPRGRRSPLCDGCAAAARRELLLSVSTRVMAAHDETFRKLAQ